MCAEAERVEGKDGLGDGMGFVIICCSKHRRNELRKIEASSVGEWKDDGGFDSS